MCGLVGMFIKNNHGFTRGQIDCLVGNFFINGWRGRHSTGAVSVLKDGSVGYVKTVGDITDLITHEYWKPFEEDIYATGKAVFGHGRFATVGKVNTRNAHPFHVKGKKGDIYFVHNGTLDKTQKLEELDKFEVDSHWLASQIANIGAEEALKQVQGAIAAIWYDDKEDVICVYRNYQRPLHWAKDSSGNLHINSEKGPLLWLSDKFSLGIKPEDIKEFEARKLYTFTKDKGFLEATTVEIQSPYAYQSNNVHWPTQMGNGSGYNRGSVPQLPGSAPRDWDGIDDEWGGYYNHPDHQPNNIRPYANGFVDVSTGKPLDPITDEEVQVDYLLDIKQLLDGKLVKVLWTQSAKIKYMVNGQMVTYSRTPLPKPNLSRIERINSTSFAECFLVPEQGNRFKAVTYVREATDIDWSPLVTNVTGKKAPEKGNVIAVESSLIQEAHGRVDAVRRRNKRSSGGTGETADIDNREASSVPIKFKPFKAHHFHIKHRKDSKEALRYWAVPNRNTSSCSYFDILNNDLDGTFVIHKRVAVEAYEFIQRTVPGKDPERSFKVLAAVVSDRDSHDIQFEFFSYGMTRVELKEATFFYGVISYIRTSTRDEYEKTGSHFVVGLTEVRQLSEAKEEDSSWNKASVDFKDTVKALRAEKSLIVPTGRAEVTQPPTVN